MAHESWSRQGMRLSLPELVVTPPKGYRLSKFLVVLAAVAVALWSGEYIQRVADQCNFLSFLTTNTVADLTRMMCDVSNRVDGAVFEYVVVGSGAAGCPAAGRLARAGHSVLLLEAGPEPHFISRVPGIAFALAGSDMDWAYRTMPNNKSCLGLAGGACPFVRGKVVGGSTSINSLMYTRGNRRDYNYFNVTGWSWEHMKPYFLRAERLRKSPKFPDSSTSYHNFTGPMEVGNFGRSGNPWHPRIIEGFKSLNFPVNPDVNAMSQIGVSQIPGYVANGERITAATAYLKDVNALKTLKILKRAQCIKIIIDENNVARGVTVAHQDKVLNVFSKREVVVSAGAVETPHILMLSGVGPKEHLQEFNIPVKSELPVGEHMSDHTLVLTLMKVDHDVRGMSNVLALAKKGFEAAQWVLTKSGPLATVGVGDITSFINTKCYDFSLKKLVSNRSECEIPSMQTIWSYVDKGLWPLAESIADRVTPHALDIKEQIFEANRNSALMVASPVLLRPKSRGSIRLASANPLEPPAIFPNYLDEAEDVDELVRAVKIMRDIADTPAFRAHNASLLRLKLPGCPGSEEAGYWACYVRHMSLSIHHAVGTAALGRVVDERLRVRGVSRLRVADASVLPLLPRGNTAAAVTAVGERLADFLLEDL